jgi:hypothetical protein
MTLDEHLTDSSYNVAGTAKKALLLNPEFFVVAVKLVK